MPENNSANLQLARLTVQRGALFCKALEAKDYERLQEAAQQALNRSNTVQYFLRYCVFKLHEVHKFAFEQLKYCQVIV